MKLYNIYFLCKTYLPELESIQTTEKKNGVNIVAYNIINWTRGKRALHELVKIDCLKEFANQAYNTLDPIARDQKEPIVSPQTMRQFMDAISFLINKMNMVTSLYESMRIEKSNNGLDVKIPSCGSLEEYIDYLKEINFIFTQCPFFLDKEEELRFQYVDVGSQWLTFMLVSGGTCMLLKVAGALVEKAANIQPYLTIWEREDKTIQEMIRKKEANEQLLDVLRKTRKSLLHDWVKELEDKFGKLKDGEEEGKVEKTIEKMATLMNKGVEFYSSIDTSNDIKALFPTTSDDIFLPDDVMKLLEQKAEE